MKSSATRQLDCFDVLFCHYMVIRFTCCERKVGGGGRKNAAIPKRDGNMQFFCVYFEGKVSNHLLQETYSALISAFVSVVIRKQLFC